MKNQKYIECPEYVGFTIKDVSEKKDCKYEESAERIYYKPGCYQTGATSVQYSVVDNHLIKRSFSSKGCTGVDTLNDLILDLPSNLTLDDIEHVEYLNEISDK